jgi:hypothetical protein
VHDPSLPMDKLASAWRSDQLAGLLATVAYVTRAKRAGCDRRELDEAFATAAFAEGCGEQPREASAMAAAFGGARTIRCSDVGALGARFATTCPLANESAGQLLPYRWHPAVQFRRAPDSYYAQRTSRYRAPQRGIAAAIAGLDEASNASGAATPRALDEAYNASGTATARAPARCSRIEVSHSLDILVGQPWLYAAPGSGQWWDPRRCVAFRNSIAAVIETRGIDVAVEAVRRAERQGDLAVLSARLAAGHGDWSRLLTQAARGDDRASLLTDYNFLWNQIMLPPDEDRERLLDSIVLVRQLNFGETRTWSKWNPVKPMLAMHYLYNASADSCIPVEDLARHVVHVPEIVDVGSARELGWKGSALGVGLLTYRRLKQAVARHISLDAAGEAPCPPLPMGSCIACTPRLCASCAIGCTAESHAIRNGGSRFDAHALQACCALSITHHLAKQSVKSSKPKARSAQPRRDVRAARAQGRRK